MAKRTGKKNSVMFTKPEEPSFLKKFKERVGYKEDNGLMDKFEAMPKATEEDLEDNDDELPQVVQLQEGDISQEDFNEILEKENPGKRKKDENGSAEEGKILFRKPTSKRSNDNDLKASTKKAKGEEDKKDQPEEDKEKKAKKKEKSNKTLLSFDDEDAED